MARSFRRLKVLALDFAADRRGATAIEYAIVAAGIAGVVVTTVYALGSSIETNFYGKLIASYK